MINFIIFFGIPKNIICSGEFQSVPTKYYNIKIQSKSINVFFFNDHRKLLFKKNNIYIVILLCIGYIFIFLYFPRISIVIMIEPLRKYGIFVVGTRFVFSIKCTRKKV